MAILLSAALIFAAGSTLSAAPVLITGIETDTVESPPRFPDQGVAGEWTRFGVPFDSMSIDTNAANAAAGNNSLAVGANWDAGGWGMGIRYDVPSVPLDLSAGPQISFMARQSTPGAARVQFTVVEVDNDIWTGVQHDVGTDYAAYFEDLSQTLVLADQGGNGVLDLANVKQVGFTLLRNGQAGYSTFHFDEVYASAEPIVDLPQLPLVTSIEPPDFTTGGFPPGAEGEWTRFGAAYNGIGVIQDAGNASNGDHFLQVDADWGAGAWVGSRYGLYSGNIDWTSYPVVAFDIRANVAVAQSTVNFVVEDTAGNISISPNVSVGTSWSTATVNLANDLIFADGPGPSTNLSSLVRIGVDFRNGVGSGTQSLFVDNVRLQDEPPPPPSNLITGIENDTVQDPPRFPGQGDPREWTRFGVHFGGMSVDTNPANAASGSNSLSVIGDWDADVSWGFGVRYDLADVPFDLSVGPDISFKARQTVRGAHRVQFTVVEVDGDIWTGAQHDITTSYEVYRENLLQSLQIADQGGDGILNLASVAQIGFTFLRNGQTGGTEFHFDEIYYDDPLPIPDNLITGIENDTVMDPPRFPGQGDPGEWTRFGAHFGGMFIDEDPLAAAAGAKSLGVFGDWDADASWGFGIRYDIPDAPLDISAGPTISFQARQSDPGLHRVKFAVVESDGDIWEGVSHNVGLPYIKFTEDISLTGQLANPGEGGDGVKDLTSIVQIGFTFLRNGQTGFSEFHIDEIYYDDASAVPPPALPVVTSMELPDFTSGGFPPEDYVNTGTEGEWTRFGAAYNGIVIVTDSLEATDGDRYLQVGASWGEGTRAGTRHKPYGSPADWSPWDRISFDLKATTADAATTVQFALFEADGDIWVSANLPAGTEWETVTLLFDGDITLGDQGGDGVLTADAIVLWGLNFDNLSFAGTQTFRVDNVRLGGDVVAPVGDWLYIR
jgi:hypothetical protein